MTTSDSYEEGANIGRAWVADFAQLEDLMRVVKIDSPCTAQALAATADDPAAFWAFAGGIESVERKGEPFIAGFLAGTKEVWSDIEETITGGTHPAESGSNGS
jgi:hypothetical protein